MGSSTRLPVIPVLLVLATGVVERAAAAPGGPRISVTATASDGAPDESLDPPAPPGSSADVLGLSTAPASAAIDPAWARYHAAFLAIARGERTLGLAILRNLRDEYPTHPVASLAFAILAELDESAQRIPDDEDSPFGARKPTTLARAELTIFQTLAGIGGGVELCGAADCQDARAFTALMTIGGGAGLTLSLLLTGDGITPGRTLLINSATGWGTWNGIALAVIADLNDERATAGIILTGHLAGLAAGIAGASLGNPRAGDISLGTTLGTWLGVLTLLGHAVNDFDADEKLAFGTLLLASDVGFVGGALLGALDIFPMSRGRTMIIDAGGVVGMLLGMGVDVLAEGDDLSSAFFGLAMAGTVLGLGVTTYLTRNWDLPEPPATLSFLPLEKGGALAVTIPL